ncbi:MAG: PmbA protein [Actinomycetota bacterium]|jgi:predicted Zn-dependent protease|nr:PmbA protein [Actinomycetota bacterium]
MSPLPISEDEARRSVQEVLEHPGADGVEVMVAASESGVTRFAGSEIIQNTAQHQIEASVRVVSQDRVAIAKTNQLDREHLSAAAEQALEAAQASPPDAEFPGLPHPQDVGRATAVMRWDEPTATASPAQRARAVTEILRVAGAGSAAGVYETSAHAFGIFSSTGIDCFDAFTRCVNTCLVDIDGATGWGERSSHRMDRVDVASTAMTATDKAVRGKGAVDGRPGTYEVILEPPAVAMLIDFLSYMGFGAKQVIEGESFLSTRVGENVAANGVTVADDVFAELSVGIGFDMEGVPKQKVEVISDGRAVRPVSDLRTARKLGTSPTGHYSGSNEFGPYAFNPIFAAGDSSLDELIGGVSDGLLVTRFHYVNILDRPATTLTGMTRDGTFRISGGEVGEAVHNFRFAQSVLDALASVDGVGSALAAFAPEYGSFGSTVAPALRLREFNLASTTSH